MRVDQGPTISLEGFRALLLTGWNNMASPILEYAPEIYAACVDNNIDPTFALAIPYKETKWGLHPGSVGWVDQKNAWGLRDHSWSSRAIDGPGSFSYYATYLDAGLDFVDLIAGNHPRVEGLYYPERNTVAKIIAIYAPPIENWTARYIEQVRMWMTEWAQAYPMPTGPTVEELVAENTAAIEKNAADIAEIRAILANWGGGDGQR